MKRPSLPQAFVLIVAALPVSAYIEILVWDDFRPLEALFHLSIFLALPLGIGGFLAPSTTHYLDREPILAVGGIAVLWLQLAALLLMLVTTAVLLRRRKARLKVSILSLIAVYALVNYVTNTCAYRLGERCVDCNLQSIKLLGGYQLEDGTSDVYWATIAKPNGAEIRFCGSDARIAHRKSEFEWYRETRINGVPAYWAIKADPGGRRSLFVEFKEVGVFEMLIKSDTVLADAFMMLSTYQPRRTHRWCLRYPYSQ